MSKLAKAFSKKEANRIDAIIQAAVCGFELPMMKLSEVADAGYRAAAQGEDAESIAVAVRMACALLDHRKPNICESCGRLEGLILLACSGGASGDIYVCASHYLEHQTAHDEHEGCAECLELVA